MKYDWRQVSAMYQRVQNATIARGINATMFLQQNAKSTSPGKKRRSEVRKKSGSASTSVDTWNLSAPTQSTL